MKGLGNRGAARREMGIIALALEGEETGEEYKYFIALQRLLRVRRYEVHLLPTPVAGHHSSPVQILNRMIEFEQEHELELGFDRVWLVFDRDTSGQIGSVTNDATRRNYGIAASNPCFELWLLLHHEDLDVEAFKLGDAKARDKCKLLKQRIGAIRSTGYLHPRSLSMAAIETAIARARDLLPEGSRNQRFPPCPGTFVYRIIEDLKELQLLPPQAPLPSAREQTTDPPP